MLSAKRFLVGKAFSSARSVLFLTPVDCVENPASAFTQHVIFFFFFTLLQQTRLDLLFHLNS